MSVCACVCLGKCVCEAAVVVVVVCEGVFVALHTNDRTLSTGIGGV